LGTVFIRLNITLSNLTDISSNLPVGPRRIGDADFATEPTALSKAQIL
jgi:flagellin